MENPRPFNKQVLINISIALLIPLIHWIYGDAWSSVEQPIGDFWRGIIILVILLFGIIGGIKEILELRYIIRSHLGWFFLTLLATAGHIMLYLAAIKYMGYDVAEEISGTTKILLIIGSLVFAFYFLFELLFILGHEIRKGEKAVRSYRWSDVLLSIYAAFGGVYIWDILLGNVRFEFESISIFLIAELFPAILLFLLLILPFKRYDVMESHGMSKTSREKTYLFLSYLLMISSVIMPRIFDSAGIVVF